MKYKAVICDLDGTLLNSQHTISPYTREIIGKVRNKGIKIFIATGRHHCDTFVFKRMLGLDSFLITSNGAKIHDENDKEIFSHNIPAHLAKLLINMEVDDEIIQNIYQDDLWYCNNLPVALQGFYKESGFTYHMTPFNEIKGDITKFFYVCHTQPAKLLALEKEIRNKFSNELNITFSLPTCLEVIQHSVSKGAAVKEVLQRENITPAEAIAFGDGLNDYEMLKTVGKGLLMGNCTPRLQELLPNNEMVATNNNDGIAKYLEKLFL